MKTTNAKNEMVTITKKMGNMLNLNYYIAPISIGNVRTKKKG